MLFAAVLVVILELIVRFGTAFGDVCGDSQLANNLELAGAWIFAVALLIPGGAGGCFE